MKRFAFTAVFVATNKYGSFKKLRNAEGCLSWQIKGSGKHYNSDRTERVASRILEITNWHDCQTSK